MKKDLSGKVFGRWVVLEEVLNYKGQSKHRYWLCECTCGNKSKVQQGSLTSGRSKSCGCLSREILARGNNRTHGKSDTKEYRSWSLMKQRCYDKNRPDYHHYGGRGITVCNRWLESFENFYGDMGDCPEGFQLDRQDNKKNFSLENCKWVCSGEKSGNRAINKNNHSGVKGVSLEAKTGRWLAMLRGKEKIILCKTFTSFEDAVKARKEAEISYFGEEK